MSIMLCSTVFSAVYMLSSGTSIGEIGTSRGDLLSLSFFFFVLSRMSMFSSSLMLRVIGVSYFRVTIDSQSSEMVTWMLIV